jgi:uncharacterized protein (UPF0332 family)
MSIRSRAHSHLRKARQFLDSARLNMDNELHDASASSAVLSGINSKDAICLALTGSTSKSEDHSRAVQELREAGPMGADLAPTFSRLLGLKTPSQYLAQEIPRSQAVKAIDWAQRMMEGASRALR